VSEGKGRREYIPPETGLRQEEIGDSPDLEAEATRAAEMAGQSPVREWRFGMFKPGTKTDLWMI